MNDKPEGFEPDQELPIETNSNGGKQSAVPYDFTAIPPLAILAVARVMKEGKKYDTFNTRPNYLKIPVADHLNHAMGHVVRYLADDTSEAHLTHAACRLLMAIGVAYHEFLDSGEYV